MPTYPVRIAATMSEVRAAVNNNRSVLETAVNSVTTKNSFQGTTTLNTPNTSVTVTHNYGSTSYVITIMPQADIGSGHRCWADTKQANSFVIRVDAALGSNTNFEWILRGT